MDYTAIHRLSGQELTTLRYYAQGLLPEMIMEKMAIAKSTLYTYRARVMEKLKIKGKNEFKKACRTFRLTDKENELVYNK